MENLKKYGNLGAAILAVVSLFFPLLSFGAEASIFGVSVSSSEAVSGFDFIFEGEVPIAYGLLICPAIVILAEFISKFADYKKLINIIAPVASIIVALVSWYLYVKDYGDFLEIVPAWGFILYIVANIGIVFLYFVKEKDIDNFSKEEIKNIGKDVLNEYSSLAKNVTGKATVVNTTAKPATSANTTVSANATPQATSATNSVIATPPVKPATSSATFSKSSKNAKDPITELRELKELLDSGILTEEEFASKKQDVLARM